jgi:hypothetical protein
MSLCSPRRGKIRFPMHKRFLLAFLLLALSSLMWGEKFDKPVRRQRVNLSPAVKGSTNRARVTCYFFPTFMVKEVEPLL